MHRDFSEMGELMNLIQRVARLQPAVGELWSWRDERRERLQRLAVDPDHAKLAIAASECPIYMGHPGSESAAKAVTRFVDDKKLRALVLTGPTGRGKTVAATWAAANLDGVLWLSAKDVRVGDVWDNLHPRCVYVPVLVVDDLGQESSDWASKELAALLESRFDKGKRSLITTNLVPAGAGRTLEMLYGARLWSRLNSSQASIVACSGPDMRRG